MLTDTEEAIKQRHAKAIAEQVALLNAWDGKSGLWVYLSFVDTERPQGSRFAGACIVKAPSIYSDALVAWRSRCNPGGEVKMVPVPDSKVPFYTYRLMSTDELNAMDQEFIDWETGHLAP